MDIKELSKSELIHTVTKLQQENATLRKIAEDAKLDDSHLNNILYRLLIDNLPFSAWMKDLTGKYITINKYFEKYVDKKFDDLLNKTEFDLFPIEIASKSTKEDREVIKYKKPITVINTVSNNNSIEFYETYKAPILNSDDKVIALFGISQNITDKVIAENNLKSNEDKYRTLTHELPIGIYRTDFDGNFIHVNLTFAKLLGYQSIDEIINKNAKDFYVNPDDRKNLISYFENNKIGVFEVQLYKKDKSIIWIKNSRKITQSSISDISYIDGIIEDITESKNSIIDLKSEKQQLNNLFEQIPLAMAIIDYDTIIRRINDTFIDFFGYTKNEIIGKSVNDIIVSEEYFCHIKDILEDLNIDNTVSFESRRIKKDGSTVDVLVIAKKFNDEKEKNLIYVVYIDITQMKQAESILSQSESKYRLLVETAFDAIYIITESGYEYVNPRFCEITQYSYQELTSPDFDYNNLLTDESKQFMNDRYELRKNGVEIDNRYDISIKNKNGDIVYLEVITSDINKGGTLKIQGVMRDITERVKLQNELRELNNQLENRVIERTAKLDKTLLHLQNEINEKRRISDELINAKEELSFLLAKEKELSLMKSKFIAMVSHEYRTPMTVILTSTYLLEKYFEMNDVLNFKSNISRIQESVQNIISLLENVLTIGKEDYLSLKANLANLDIVATLNNLFNEFKLNSENIHNFEFISNVDTLYLNSDVILLRNIFSNLLSNAVKYSKPKSIIKMQIEDNNEFIDITVTDEGIGIPEDEFNQLYEPFSRLSNVSSEIGSGLGLAIVKRAVEQLDAQIFVSSKINVGSEFQVRFKK